MKNKSLSIFALAMLLASVLPACKSDSGSAGGTGSGGGTTTTTYTIGGTVSGLTGTLVLQNNGGDDRTVTANGSFTFAAAVSTGVNYDVTVKTNPTSQVCQLNNGAGVATANVTNVAITCATDINWVQDAYLKASNSEAGDQFGYAVSISGTILVVGAISEDSSQTTITNTDNTASGDNAASDAAGAVYVFKREANGDWVQDAYLKPSNGQASDQFGFAVAVSGLTIAVGAPYEDSNQTTITNADSTAAADNAATDSGAVYVFTKRTDGEWVQDAYLKPSNGGTGDYFGASVAISDATIAVGAHQEDSNETTFTNTDSQASADNSATNAGAVYVFKREVDGTWIQDAYLKASNAQASDQFGYSVAISGSTLAVGAYNEGSNQTVITNTDNTASNTNALLFGGAVYVFQRGSDGNWLQDAYLKASNTPSVGFGGDYEFFSSAIAISGSTIVVGAYGEDSSQTTVSNADGTASADNLALTSGAAYVYKRDANGDWVQDAYLKPSVVETMDYFGFSVGISGSTIVVGAYGEDSNQTTIGNTDGSASSNNLTSMSGSAYVFKRDANGDWVQDAYLKASNASSNNYFGQAVAISGSTIIIGARGESSNQASITNTNGSASSNTSAANAGGAYVFKAY